MDLDFAKVIKRGRRKPLYSPTDTSVEVEIGQQDVKRMLPHRDPMLLVDRISAVDLESLTMRAHRRIDPHDPVFAGHFPDMPVYPGALLVEACGQSALCLHHLLLAGRAEVLPDDTPAPVRLLKIHHALFQKEALPGDEITLMCKRLSEDSYTMICAAQALKGDDICALVVMEVFLVGDED